MSGRILRFTHNAASVQVYDMTGICVAQYRNVDEVELDLPDGIYIVKAKSDSGSLITSKLKIHYLYETLLYHTAYLMCGRRLCSSIERRFRTGIETAKTCGTSSDSPVGRIPAIK